MLVHIIDIKMASHSFCCCCLVVFWILLNLGILKAIYTKFRLNIYTKFDHTAGRHIIFVLIGPWFIALCDDHYNKSRILIKNVFTNLSVHKEISLFSDEVMLPTPLVGPTLWTFWMLLSRWHLMKKGSSLSWHRTFPWQLLWSGSGFIHTGTRPSRRVL